MTSTEGPSTLRSLAPLWAQYRLLALRLLLVMLLYTVCRGIFYLYNKDLLEVASGAALWRMFVGGLRFDLTATLYTNVLIIFLSLLPFHFTYTRIYQRVLFWLFFVINALSTIPNLADTVYFRFTQKRTSMTVFQEFANEDKGNFLRFFWDYWEITLTGIVLITLFFFASRLLPQPKAKPLLPPYAYYPWSVLCLAGGIYMSVVGMRGGFTRDTRPITLSNANVYIDKPQQRALVLNTPFALIRTIGKSRLPEYRYMPAEEVPKYFNAVYTPVETPQTGRFKGRNVVLLIWESFAREWVGTLNKDVPGYKGYTPFIDELLPKSYYFDRAFANGYQSIDAMPSIFTSIIRPNNSFILSIYSGNLIPSVVDRVRELGYTTAFFHGAPNGSMGFDAFTKQAGFQKYFGMNEYGHSEDYDGYWGIWDEYFLQYVAKEIGTLKEPFFATEFTLSSHHPFRVPEQYQSMLPSGPHPMHQAVAYTDYAMRRFFETASKQPWYNNTIFIIVADHSVPGVLEKYKTTAGAYQIPIILFDPRGELVGRDATTIVQQADLYPTILDLLGDMRPIVTYGNSFFNETRPHVAISDRDGVLQIIEGDYLLLYDGGTILGFYNITEDPRQQRDLKDQKLPVMQQMLLRLQAYLQDFSWRMNKDKLTSLEPSE